MDRRTHVRLAAASVLVAVACTHALAQDKKFPVPPGRHDRQLRAGRRGRPARARHVEAARAGARRADAGGERRRRVRQRRPHESPHQHAGRLHDRHADRPVGVGLGGRPRQDAGARLRLRRRGAVVAFDALRPAGQQDPELPGPARRREGEPGEAPRGDRGLRHAGRHRRQVPRHQGLPDGERAVRQARRALPVPARRPQRGAVRGAGRRRAVPRVEAVPADRRVRDQASPRLSRHARLRRVRPRDRPAELAGDRDLEQGAARRRRGAARGDASGLSTPRSGRSSATRPTPASSGCRRTTAASSRRRTTTRSHAS